MPGEPAGKTQSSRINIYGFELSDEEIDAGAHRGLVGGMWDEIGPLQLDYLRSQGLRPTDRLLDIGCGSLRGGIHLARYLETGNYYGFDSNESLIKAAVVKEIPEAGIGDRLPAANLKVSARFDCDFGVRFDVALAVSVFTHLPLNHVQLCLFRLAQVMTPGGRFYATFFAPPAGTPFDRPVRQPVVTSYPERDTFHYRPADLAWAAASVADWDFRLIGDWGHPRGQQMALFTRHSSPRPSVLARAALAQARPLARAVRRRVRARR